MVPLNVQPTYLCPLCKAPLCAGEATMVCPKGHGFDRAKEGYINLLPVQKKRSKDPGDNKEMMKARRLFLESGAYQKLSDRLGELVLGLPVKPNRILDLGCGEGYYTHRLQQGLAKAGIQPQFYGLDISRAALKSAAKRYQQIHFCVASSFETPFETAFFDLIMRIYAPSKAEELKRLVKPGGYLLTASAGPMHHFAVKKRIYDTPRLHEDKEEQIDGFELVSSERLQWQLDMDTPELILAFLEMTPYAWKFTPEARRQLASEPFSCELDFRINLQRRML
ncbi:23S rRNA (guanine(745)-N(1))-methyltransferase [Shewanella litorisediminis]|uniref:23S rRNA (Guanine(745)-N(1))-methyltransferase n=1 Tax=Shewanella litorisediminis TaxID=1173586 RepID=A0ABX7FZ00_9GAMM|nr:23S rRNA (guanine(745)-N(1))-methyltransferase [Shewanella litorisediminis]MCL2918772.1 23S rRNA (guanine(745)-N(1))-methyltransferase [Shewanella litorisediminis]QRH00259.1 23S rRNA (guanine(745)-N(1))-methyltransferase [Shewanella litorisediminis]